MEVKLADTQAPINLSEGLFSVEFNEALVHQAVVAYMSGGRQGSRRQLTRAEVNGGGQKPWRQKGTGRARAGTTRGPIWRGGGVTFAARPQSYEQKINRKMYRGALRSIFAELLRQDRLVIVENIELEAPKTKQLVAKLNDLNTPNALLVIEGFDEKLYLAARNLPHVDVASVAGLNPCSLVAFEKVVMTAAALRKVEEWLA